MGRTLGTFFKDNSLIPITVCRTTTPIKYSGAAISMQPVEAQPGVATVQFPDPLTGEDMANDWKIKLAFKVKLGEKGAAPATPEPAKPGAPQKPGARPGGKGGRPG